MVDRVYQGAIPEFRKAIRELKRGFAQLPTVSTDWNRIRVEPLLRHVESLEAVLRSKKLYAQIARLKRGVSMFHSDLVYLNGNLKDLKAMLERERRSSARR